MERYHKGTTYNSPSLDNYDYSKYRSHTESHNEEKKQTVSDLR
jgi:hypothetical protein